MKTFTLPQLPFVYDLTYGTIIYPYKDGEFIVQCKIFDRNWGGATNFELRTNELLRNQFFIVGQELKVLMSRTDQQKSKKRLAAGEDYVFGILHDNENKFYIGQSFSRNELVYLSVPELKICKLIKKQQNQLITLHTNKQDYGPGKTVLLDKHKVGRIFKMFMYGIKVEETEIAVVKFHQFNFYDVKVMKLTEDPGEKVISAAVSNDGLTACALVGCTSNTKLPKLIVWDLDV